MVELEELESGEALSRRGFSRSIYIYETLK